jgi:hypothetical protein
MGIWGGILAVVGTFVLTIPFRLYVVSRIIGGVYFPAWFCLRITAVLTALGWGFHWAVERLELFSLMDNRWLNLMLLFGISGLYLVVFVFSVRYLRLIRQDDVKEFQALEIKQLNLVFRFLVR